MTQPLILVAASGLAREAAEAARAGNSYHPMGFVDDNPELWGTTIGGLAVLGGTDVLIDFPGASVIVCAGKGTSRQALRARLAAIGITEDRYASVIHPSASIPDSCQLGPGCIVLANCVLTADVLVGRHVVCMPNVVLTHDDSVADYATLAAGVVVGGSVQIGSRSYLGMNCSIRPGVVVGADVTVGMGATVLRDVPAGEIWVGNPAAPMLLSDRVPAEFGGAR